MPRRSDSTRPARRSWVRWWLTVDSVSPRAAARSPLFSSPDEGLNRFDMIFTRAGSASALSRSATCRASRFLGNLVEPNVEVRRRDITGDDVEPACYDLVHSRLLLMHLSDPAGALRRMAAALRPGGWLVAVTHARVVITDWKDEYNHHRRHSALVYQTPASYVAACTHR